MSKNNRRPTIKLSKQQRQQRQMAFDVFDESVSSAKAQGKPRVTDFIVPRTDHLILGPEEARDLLAKSQGNRHARKDHVLQMAKMMLDGEWYFADPVMVDTDDVLIGGHQRLMAVIEAGMFVPMTVMTGVDPNYARFANQQKDIRGGDVLKMLGYSNCNDRIAMVRIASELTAQRRVPIQAKEYQQWEKVFKGLNWVVSNVTINKKTPWRKASITGAFVYAYNTDPAKVKEFATAMVEGEGFKKGDPIYTFREWYLLFMSHNSQQGARTGASAGGGDERVHVFTARLLHCLRAYIEGTKVKTLKTIKPETVVDDISYFRKANETKAAKVILDYWKAPRMHPDKFRHYITMEMEN